ncbi:hypothetical protein [Streptomyces kaempferi]|uniref:FAD-dependent urate hydroxylase HpyO FAD/NAD(P)-binding domain-containing protein n=1 Tax=Streptomyces kaempferi TaxID=333725 RepID=A0ABW3XFP0_9ACTN
MTGRQLTLATTTRPTLDSDIAFIGGGFRTTTFLASAPALLLRRVRVYERGTTMGPGGFARYGITTTSIGSRFFKHLDLSGPFVPRGRSSALTDVARAEQPVAMDRLATALTTLGRTLQDALGADGVRLGSTVVAVHADRDRHRVDVRLADGSTESGRHAVLATGRTERAHPELACWRPKVLLSGTVISTAHRSETKDRLLAAGGRPVVVAGSSHSAMSALQILLDLRAELRAEHPGAPLPSVQVVRRGPARLMYDSADLARCGQVPGRERPFDPASDVCPTTGIVYRDSGLRHRSRALYCALWAGELPGATLVDAPVIAVAADRFEEAALVVQALGYHGQAPDLYVDGALVRPGDSPDRLLADDDGALLVNGVAHPLLSVLRVEPTPLDRRDNTAYASDLYQRLAERLAAQFVEAGA